MAVRQPAAPDTASVPACPTMGRGRFMRARPRWTGALALLSLSLISCGGVEGLYPVQGKVTYRGEPAAGALVTFQSEGPAPTGSDGPLVPTALVGPDGSFSLSCGEAAPGAPPGRYKVLILWRQG